MSGRLTPTDLAAHLACPHLTQLERQRRAGTLTVTFLPDPRLEALQERGRQHEDAYLAKLRAAGRTIRDLRDTRDPSATIDAMREGCDAIVQAPLANEAFYGIADVLLRRETPSKKLGAYSYEPVDTKLARETRATTILQLCTYCELLTAAQGLEPEHFYVVTPLREETYRTADFGPYYRFVRSGFASAATTEPAPDTYPDPVGYCEICRYWKHCDDRRRDDDHPSLIAGIHAAHVREFQAQEMPTLAAIARCDGALPKEPSRGRRETYAGLGQQARLQLAARGVPLPPLEYLPIEAGRGFARLPEPSPGDIFLDFEGDPFAGENGLEYLTGFHARDAAGEVLLEQVWALGPVEEKAACERFIDFVTARLKKHPGLHIYHFGAYEPATMKRLCARHDTRGDELDRLLRGDRFIDLHVVVREAMRIGIERYGLKELELLHAFTRKQDLKEAAASRRDVELAIEMGDADSITAELRFRVAKYNAEDCLSTESLRDWLEARRAERVAAGHAIDRPPDQPSAPSEAVSERDLRIETLKAELLAQVPEDPATRSDEHRAIALLASMLSYFRQEEKNAWWEHFRLRELPADEQLEEREMLAGLEFVEVLPKVGKQKNERRRYRFPPQETAVGTGDKVFFTKYEDPEGEEAGSALKVEEMDLATSTVVLSSGRFKAGQHPTAVFGEQVVGPMPPLEKALLAFAEHVRDNGLATTGPYAAASALLLRRPPTNRRAKGGPLRTPGESNVDATRRLSLALDHEVLPIQGPPGSGKTYAGARAIVELARQGKRIGITAVSHKVIDNLLDATREAAEKAKVSLRLVHKHNEEPPTGIEYIDSAGDALAAVAPGAVVGGTVWLWARDEALDSLDYLFIDEAGQTSLAQALVASRAARNVVLLGDPQQLEQPQRGAHPEGADVAALVHLLGKGRATLGDEQGLFLDATFRLHPEICKFTSELYYERRLQPVAGLERQRVEFSSPPESESPLPSSPRARQSPQWPGAQSGLFLVEIDHSGNQALSREEVEAVTQLAESFLQPGTTWTDRDGNTRDLLPNDLLVVAPYNAQVSTLRTRLSALGVHRVGTVDKFQGQEAPVVIYSCTSSSAEDAPRGMAFLYDPHRFNVATSRARGLVIVVASPLLFETACRTPEQMRWANGMCRYREIAQAVTPA